MLGSMFSSSLKRVSRLSLPYFIPKKNFAVAQAQPETPQGQTSGTPSDVFVDPKLENLSKYIINFNLDAAKLVFKNCDYDKYMAPALNLYQTFGFNDIQLKFIFRRKPSLLRLYPTEEKNDIKKLSDYAQDKWNLNQHQIRSLVLRNPWIINLSNEQITQKAEFLRSTLKMTHKEIRRLLIIYPKVFNLSEDHILRTIEIVSEYMNLPDRTIGIIAGRYPYFLCINHKNLLGNMKVLVNKNFTKEQMASILKRHAEVFTVRPGSLENSFIMGRKAGLVSGKLTKVYTENPRLMTVDPTTIIPRKLKLLRQYQVSWKTIGAMVRLFPRTMIKSIGSTNLKLRYLTQRMKVDLRKDKAFPAILNFSYAHVIRPRGEMMMRKGEVHPWATVLNLTDQEFAQKMEATVEELNAIKAEYKEVNNELDYKTRFFSRYVSNRGANAKY